MNSLAKFLSLCVCTGLLFATRVAAEDPGTREEADLAGLEERMEDIAVVPEDPSWLTESVAMGKTLTSCDPWLKYTLPYSPSLNSVAFNGSRWVVVGGYDDTYYSDDGVNWTWRDGGVNKTFTKVRWFTSRFIVIGDDGVIVTSPDGVSWTQRGTPTSQELRGLAVSANRAVAVGRGGAVLWSADGQNWNLGQSPTVHDIFCVEFFAGRFRFIDEDGNVYDSTDGSVWQFRTLLPSFPEYGSMMGMGATSSTLVAMGYDVTLPTPGGGVIYTTTNGTTWQKVLPPCPTLRGATFGAGKWVGVGDGAIVESTNATNWTVVPSPLSDRIWDVAYGDDQFIAAGWDGIARQTCDPSSCTYSISPTSANYDETGGSGTFAVSTQAGCPWTATSNNSWIFITSGASGTGSGTVGYSVDANNSSSSRTGTISAAGRTFTITQSGSTDCNYSISPTSHAFGPSGGSGSVSVSTTAGCAWTAASNNGWIHVTSGSSGTGSGTVNYSVDANAGGSRTGTMTIADHTFTVTQSGSGGGDTYTYQVAGIAHAGGAGFSVWRSTLCVTNRSGSTANLTLVYRMAGTATVTRTYTLQNNRIKEWEDVAESLFNQSTESSGSIEITSSVPVIVVARTYNEAPDGTFGQGMPGNDDSATLTSGQMGVLPQLKKTSAFRTNVGLMNHGSLFCNVRIKLYSATGVQIGNTIDTTVPAKQWKQINDVFDEAGVGSCSIGYATIEVRTAGGKIWAYGSVVDNGTGDPTTISLFIE